MPWTESVDLLCSHVCFLPAYKQRPRAKLLMRTLTETTVSEVAGTDLSPRQAECLPGWSLSVVAAALDARNRLCLVMPGLTARDAERLIACGLAARYAEMVPWSPKALESGIDMYCLWLFGYKAYGPLRGHYSHLTLRNAIGILSSICDVVFASGMQGALRDALAEHVAPVVDAEKKSEQAQRDSRRQVAREEARVRKLRKLAAESAEIKQLSLDVR